MDFHAVEGVGVIALRHPLLPSNRSNHTRLRAVFGAQVKGAGQRRQPRGQVRLSPPSPSLLHLKDLIGAVGNTFVSVLRQGL